MKRRDFIQKSLFVAFSATTVDGLSKLNEGNLKKYTVDYFKKVKGLPTKVLNDPILTLKVVAGTYTALKLTIKAVEFLESRFPIKIGSSASNENSEALNNPNFFMSSFQALMLSIPIPISEEFVFRYLPTAIAEQDANTTSLEVIFISVVCFAYFHNMNFKKIEFEYDSIPLPQLFGGIGFYALFKNFGIEYAVFAHILLNSMVALPLIIQNQEGDNS
jgi:membrane protease YdiL (CAAX protease family)